MPIDNYEQYKRVINQITGRLYMHIYICHFFPSLSFLFSFFFGPALFIYFIFLLSCVFNDSALKCLLRGTDIHEIDHAFLFLKVIWGGGGGGGQGGCTNLF